MTKLLSLLAVAASTLGLVAVSVFGLQDKHLFVSPPEARAEGFVRSIETGRYDQARQYLSDEMQRRLADGALERFRHDLIRRFGEIEDVKGERGTISGENASAHAILRFQGGASTVVRVELIRIDGQWDIDSFTD